MRYKTSALTLIPGAATQRTQPHGLVPVTCSAGCGPVNWSSWTQLQHLGWSGWEQPHEGITRCLNKAVHHRARKCTSVAKIQPKLTPVKHERPCWLSNTLNSFSLPISQKVIPNYWATAGYWHPGWQFPVTATKTMKNDDKIQPWAPVPMVAFSCQGGDALGLQWQAAQHPQAETMSTAHQWHFQKHLQQQADNSTRNKAPRVSALWWMYS